MYLSTKKSFKKFQLMKGEKKLYHFYRECKEVTRKVRTFVRIFKVGLKTDASSYI